MDLAGRFLSQVNPEAGGGVQPSWSPDGKQVAYVVGGDFEPRVVVQRVGDVSVREIVRDAMLPVFSPDGGSLAFVETRQARYRDVHVYRFRDGTTRRLTRLESEDAYPTWSPDGRQIAFQAELAGRRELWSVPSEGGEPRQVTAGDGEKSHPKWSPVDADEVLFLLDHKNACVVSAGTGRVRQITHFVEANVTMDYPSWSPDGARVYFSLSKKTGDVHVLDGYQ
jgi:TolB protein